MASASASKRAASAPRISFCQTISNDHLRALPVPTSFFANGGVLEKTVTVETPDGAKSKLEFASGSFGKASWKAFCRKAGIKEGDSVVFRSVGASALAVEVYSDGCFVSAPQDAAAKRQKLANFGEEGQHLEVGLAEQEEDEEEFVFTNCEVRVLVNKMGVGTIVRRAGKGKHQGAQPVGDVAVAATKGNEDDEQPTAPTPKRQVTTPTRSKAQPVGSRRSPRSAGKAEANVVKSSTARKAIPQKPSSASKSTAVLKKVADPPSFKRSAQKTPKSSGKKAVIKPLPSGEGKALAKAHLFKPLNPHTVVTMKKGHLQPSYMMNLPASDFTKQHMPEDVTQLQLVDGSSDRSWEVRWLGRAKTCMSGGWKYFAQDHNLVKGDALIFELVKRDTLMVHVYKADETASNNAGEDAATGGTSAAAAAAAEAAEAAAAAAAAGDAGEEDAVEEEDEEAGAAAGQDGEQEEAANQPVTEKRVVTETESGSKLEPLPLSRTAADDGDDDADEDYNPEEDEEGKEAGFSLAPAAAA